MWTAYREIARQYDRLPLQQERRLIARAQRGSTKSAEEIVMRLVGFVMYRLRDIVYPSVLWRWMTWTQANGCTRDSVPGSHRRILRNSQDQAGATPSMERTRTISGNRRRLPWSYSGLRNSSRRPIGRICWADKEATVRVSPPRVMNSTS